jgi:CheY-like chemotaxis protein
MRVLVVDDILSNRLILTEILKNLEIEYDEAVNGREAVEALERMYYDLILMDIEMPVMNGLETTRYIREKFPHPKNQACIVALTAHDPQLFFKDFEDIGFDQLLTKPYSLDKIKNLIEEAGIR